MLSEKAIVHLLNLGYKAYCSAFCFSIGGWKTASGAETYIYKRGNPISDFIVKADKKQIDGYETCREMIPCDSIRKEIEELIYNNVGEELKYVFK